MKKGLSNIILWLGIVLIACSIILVIHSQINRNNITVQMSQTVEDLYSLMPEIHNGFLDDRADTHMASVQLNDEDYVGVFEIPLYKTVCPVAYATDNESLKNHPCRYSGSIYSRDLIIGGTADQLGFSDFITVGDEISFTDMTGAKFTYSVDSIIVQKDFSPESFTENTYDLVLYIKDSYSSVYTVIFCKI